MVRDASLALIVLAGLPLSMNAQTQSGKAFLRCAKTPRSVQLDLATGTVTRGARTVDRAITTVLDFKNNDLGGFVGWDTGNSACMWVDTASKGQVSGNASDLMSRVLFAYCSAAQDPRSGGAGGSCQLGFYEGGSVGSLGSPIGTFHLTGLPGNTMDSSINGGFACYFIEVTFPELVAFADGPIQYSWQFVDLGTDGVLAATFPFLACVDSCRSAGPDAQGMRDVLDQYCPPGSAMPWTISSGLYLTSISMDIREATDVSAVASSWNSENINVDELVSSTVVVGGTFGLAIVTGHDHGAGGPMSVSVRQSCVNGPNAVSPLGGRAVELLIGGPLALKQVGTHDGTVGAFPSTLVPLAPSLVGASWAAQATLVGGGFADLTSARCGTIGTVP